MPGATTDVYEREKVAVAAEIMGRVPRPIRRSGIEGDDSGLAGAAGGRAPVAGSGTAARRQKTPERRQQGAGGRRSTEVRVRQIPGLGSLRRLCTGQQDTCRRKLWRRQIARRGRAAGNGSAPRAGGVCQGDGLLCRRKNAGDGKLPVAPDLGRRRPESDKNGQGPSRLYHRPRLLARWKDVGECER